MTKFNSIIFLFIVTTFLISCDNKKIQITNLDSELWRADILECTGYRKSTIDGKLVDLEEFVGLSEKEVVSIIGRPDETLLYKRAQKFYNYNIDCGGIQNSNRTLRFRFSALGYINEVLLIQK